MPSLAQLQEACASYLNRRDFIEQGVFPGWVLSVETELTQTLRTRAQETSAYQNIDADEVALPFTFATMASIRDATTWEPLALKDEWSGHALPKGIACAYRIFGNCIEFLPHPMIPDPPDPNWVPQQVLMTWYAKPVPLILPGDTNVILENHYDCYLYGVVKRGAIWALDEARTTQMDGLWSQAITRANLHTQQSQYSGAPYVAEMAVAF